MKHFLLLFAFIGLTNALRAQAQHVYTILADSVKITNCDSAELIIENHTQAVRGFLFNTGNGRTIFKRAVQPLNDSLYLIGADTLKVVPSNKVLTPFTGWTTTGNTGIIDGVNYLGTTDNAPINFRIGLYPAGRIANDNTGNTAIGILANNSGPGGNPGYNNSAFGYNAIVGNISGHHNTAVGASSIYDNTTGSGNSGFGAQCLYTNTTGSFNTAIGSGTLGINATGNFNTAVGLGAGPNNISGSNNIYIGYNSGASIASGNYNTIIGGNVSGLSATLSNNIILADGQGNKRLRIDNIGTTFLNGYIAGAGSVPGNAAGTGAGTSPAITIIGSNISGDITIVTGTSPAGSNATIATFTYANSFAFPANSFPNITPANAVTAALSGATMVFATGTTTSFSIIAGTTGLTASTTYKWHYSITGN